MINEKVSAFMNQVVKELEYRKYFLEVGSSSHIQVTPTVSISLFENSRLFENLNRFSRPLIPVSPLKIQTGSNARGFLLSFQKFESIQRFVDPCTPFKNSDRISRPLIPGSPF